MLQLFAVCAPGLEPLLLGEITALGLSGQAQGGGVALTAPFAEVPRLNLWLRTASRVLARLGEVQATAFPELVKKASALPWEQFVKPGAKVALRVTCRKSRLYHSDAVAERLQLALEARLGGKVKVVKAAAAEDEEGASAQLFVARFDHDVCTVSADSSGALLHRRGWRGPQAKAPLRETLAAAVLLGAGWSGESALCDPLCGSGTIAIEGALLAMRRAPGLSRGFAFEQWRAFSRASWDELRAAARAGERPLAVRIEASDQDAGAVAAARENAARAGVALELAVRPVALLPAAEGAGLIACNPPYGVRVSADLAKLFRELAEAGKRRPGYRLAALVAEGGAEQKPGLRWERVLKTQNGGIPVVLLRP